MVFLQLTVEVKLAAAGSHLIVQETILNSDRDGVGMFLTSQKPRRLFSHSDAHISTQHDN